jgi:hypothetical protein
MEEPLLRARHLSFQAIKSKTRASILQEEKKKAELHYWTGLLDVMTNGKADLHVYPKGRICIPPSTCRHAATSFYNMLK